MAMVYAVIALSLLIIPTTRGNLVWCFLAAFGGSRPRRPRRDGVEESRSSHAATSDLEDPGQQALAGHCGNYSLKVLSSDGVLSACRSRQMLS